MNDAAGESFRENEEVIVFVDVADSEQASDPDDETTRSMIGVVFGSDALAGIKDYKSTKANRAKKSLEKKKSTAQKITDAIASGKMNCRATLVMMDGKSFYGFGQDMLDDLVSRGILTIVDNKYKLDSVTIPSATARGLAGYAAAMCYIVTEPARIAQKNGTKRVIICLDQLPSSKNCKPGNLMRIVMHHPDFMPIWNDLMKHFDVEFVFSDKWIVTDKDGNQIDSKLHPKLIIADWLSRSASASIDAQKWIDTAVRYTEEDRKVIAGPIFALHDKGWLKDAQLGRLKLKNTHSSGKG